MKFQNVLVTGGSGRLGRHVVDALRGCCEVTVFDRAPPGPDVAHVEGDIMNLDAVRRAVAGRDAVVHLAAHDLAANVAGEEFMRVNTLGTWHVLQSARDAGVRRIVQCSSITATGLGAPEAERPHYLPVDETHPCEPWHPYGLSKRVGEVMARSLVRPGGPEIVVLRPVLVAFADTIRKVMARRRAEGPKRGIYAYVSPEDAGRAFRLALEIEKAAFETVFVAASDSTSEVPTLELMERVFGTTPHLRRPEVYEGHPHAGTIDLARARALLGFEPTSRWADLLRAAEAG